MAPRVRPPLPIFFWALVALVSAALTLLYLQNTGQWFPTTVENIGALRAPKPYQFRVLLPFLAGKLADWTPLSLGQTTALFVFAAIFLAQEGFARLLALFFQPTAARIYSLAMPYALLWNYVSLNSYFYLYDVPAVTFFVWGLLFLLQRRWFGFFVTLFFAALNRETSCFLVLALLLTGWNSLPRRELVARIALGTAIWLGVKIGLSLLFAHNPGAKVAEWHLDFNLNFLRALLTGSVGEFPGGQSLIFVFGGLWPLILLPRPPLPALLKRLLWMVPPFAFLMLIFGVWAEVRIFGELIPVVLLAALWRLDALFRQGRGLKLAPFVKN